MPTPTGPSIFVDIYACTFTPTGGSAFPVFGISRISLNRSRTLIRGQNNNTLRTVATHTVAIEDTVSIETEDGNAYNTLMATTLPGVLTFNNRAAAHNIYTNTLADETVTISNLVFDKVMSDQTSKAIGKQSATGFCLESSSGDSVDPISIVPATSPPADTYN